MLPIIVPVAAAAGIGGGFLGFQAASGTKKIALAAVAIGVCYAIAKKQGVF